MHKLAEIVPGGMNRRVRLCDSGREAMAQALVLARNHTGRDRVVYLAESQGRPECGADVAALVVHPLDPRFAAAATVCREHGALLVDDETLLAPGISGRLLGVQGMRVRPDLVVLGRGLGAGLPLGAVVAMSSTLRWSRAGTGGSVAACRAALSFLELLETGLLDSVRVLAAYMAARLAELAEYDVVQGVGGAGLALVLRLARPKAVGVAAVCRDEGLLVGVVSESVLAMEPPLVADRDGLDRAMVVLGRALARFDWPRRSSVFGRFLETVERDRLLPEGSCVLVAVSGGADSVCLLDLLLVVAPRMHLRLHGFHMNHRLRAAARRDEEFVRALFEQQDVPLVVIHSDVARYAKRHRVGLEEAGRTLRYRHMERVAHRVGCDCVALGHTADDNLETILLNLARGTGPAGLAGIPVRRSQFVRPMLDLERTDVMRYLRARGLDWVEDESNRDPRFRRNLVRARAMAALREVNPGAGANARRAARLLGEEGAFLDALAAEAREVVVSRRHGRIVIDPVRLSRYNIVLQRRLVKRLLPGLDSHRIGRVLRFCSGRSTRLVLERRLELQRNRGVVEIARADTEGLHA